MTITQLVCLYLPLLLFQQERWKKKKALFVSCLLRNEVREVWDSLSFHLPSPPLGSNTILCAGQWCAGARDRSMRLMKGCAEVRSDSGTLGGDVTGLGEHVCTKSVPACAFTVGWCAPDHVQVLFEISSFGNMKWTRWLCVAPQKTHESVPSQPCLSDGNWII